MQTICWCYFIMVCKWIKIFLFIQIWDQLDSEDRELRYSKLQFLLNKSTMYTKYLIQRIERQKQEEKRKTERLAKKLAKKVYTIVSKYGIFTGLAKWWIDEAACKMSNSEVSRGLCMAMLLYWGFLSSLYTVVTDLWFTKQSSWKHFDFQFPWNFFIGTTKNLVIVGSKVCQIFF